MFFLASKPSRLEHDGKYSCFWSSLSKRYSLGWDNPSQDSSGKWRFSSGSPTKKCNNPGGDWNPGRGDNPSYSPKISPNAIYLTKLDLSTETSRRDCSVVWILTSVRMVFVVIRSNCLMVFQFQSNTICGEETELFCVDMSCSYYINTNVTILKQNEILTSMHHKDLSLPTIYTYIYTLPETNMAPENQWLEDKLSFGKPYFQVLCKPLVSGSIYICSIQPSSSNNTTASTLLYKNLHPSLYFRSQGDGGQNGLHLEATTKQVGDDCNFSKQNGESNEIRIGIPTNNINMDVQIHCI